MFFRKKLLLLLFSLVGTYFGYRRLEFLSSKTSMKVKNIYIPIYIIPFHSLLYNNSCRRISHEMKKKPVLLWLQRVEICNSVSNNFRDSPQSDTLVHNSSQRLWLKFNWFFPLFYYHYIFIFTSSPILKMSKRFVRFIGQ